MHLVQADKEKTYEKLKIEIYKFKDIYKHMNNDIHVTDVKTDELAINYLSPLFFLIKMLHLIEGGSEVCALFKGGISYSLIVNIFSFVYLFHLSLLMFQ